MYHYKIIIYPNSPLEQIIYEFDNARKMTKEEIERIKELIEDEGGFEYIAYEGETEEY